jgi:hypothetical protein
MSNICQKHRTTITRKILQSDTLRGLDRNKTKGQAIAEIARALEKAGNFSLDTVTGDILLGDHGCRFLSFSENGETVENAAIYFVWEKLDDDRTEFLAYVS